MARIAWNASGTEEESRAYLQARLERLSALMFWSFVVFLGGLALMYWRYPAIAPAQNHIIFSASIGGLLLLGGIWRLWLARGPRSLASLHQIDVLYAIGTGLLFGLGGYLSTDLPPAPFSTFLYACLTVLSRAIVVPSTPKRTLVMASLTLAPFVLAAIAIALDTPGLPLGMPPVALISSVLVIAASTAALAATGSSTTYNLQRRAHAAMQLGQYTLGREIGRGGMGSVHVAHHVLLRRPTAIKLLQPERVGAANLDRLEREVQSMSQLTHPNTVAVFDYGRSPEGIFYYAMEYLDGIDLEHLVVRYGRQPGKRVAEILAQVCGALAEAHGRGLVHRDIKPGNVILCERGGMPDVAKVVDFGLVRQVDEGAGRLEGTPGYIAPEVVVDNRIGPEADLYALGVVGYYLLTGKRVFAGKGAQLCAAHVTETPVDVATLANVPDALARAIMACLAKAPADRPTAAHLAIALRAVAGGDWDDAKARAWWLEFRHRRQQVPSTTDPTLSVTVDLGHRLP
jgi:serine/threonine-protein kinase